MTDENLKTEEKSVVLDDAIGNEDQPQPIEEVPEIIERKDTKTKLSPIQTKSRQQNIEKDFGFNFTTGQKTRKRIDLTKMTKAQLKDLPNKFEKLDIDEKNEDFKEVVRWLQEDDGFQNLPLEAELKDFQ